MVFTLSAGDVIRFGDAVTLTVVAVEGDLVRFGLESPGGECPAAGPDYQKADPQQGWWELN
jgi:Global regulator protein family